MCGLAGWIDLRKNSAGPSVLTRMTDAIAHRGPDGDGAYHTQTRDGRYAFALGHRRLAMRSPESGAQPMFSRDGRIALALTGRIYNFRELRDELLTHGYVFSTRTDTEVLLKAWRAWGIDCLRRLHGAFGLALWDADREILFIARDRFGQKPLYFHQTAERILFASEIKSILAHPGVNARQDLQSALDYLRYRYVPAPATMFEGIEKFMPGSYALWQNGRMAQTVFARPPDGDDAPRRPAIAASAAPVQAFTEALDQSVGRCMSFDMPMGAFLSGDIESAAIVAMMSRHSRAPIHTFSAAFEKEAPAAISGVRKVARRFRTTHHEWRMDARDLAELLPEATRCRDAPMAQPADVALLSLSRIAAQSVKVVLSGDGANEILAGYAHHRYESLVALYQKVIPPFAHEKIFAPLIDALPARYPRARALFHFLGLRDAHERLPRWSGAIDPTARSTLVAAAPPARKIGGFAFAAADAGSPLRRCLFFDQASGLPDNLLECADHMAMAASIDARMPFVDYALAALMSSLPDRFRIRGRRQKWVLYEAMRGVLPLEVLAPHHAGLRMPISLWFRTTLKDCVSDTLLQTSSRAHDFYRRDMLRDIVDQHMSSRADHGELIWSLLSLEMFQREYGLAC